jgi:hypothetical protein
VEDAGAAGSVVLLVSGATVTGAMTGGAIGAVVTGAGGITGAIGAVVGSIEVKRPAFLTARATQSNEISIGAVLLSLMVKPWTLLLVTRNWILPPKKASMAASDEEAASKAILALITGFSI